MKYTLTKLIKNNFAQSILFKQDTLSIYYSCSSPSESQQYCDQETIQQNAEHDDHKLGKKNLVVYFTLRNQSWNTAEFVSSNCVDVFLSTIFAA